MNGSFRVIFALVVFVHGVFLAALAWQPPWESLPVSKKKVSVHTIELSPPQKTVIAAAPSTQPQSKPKPKPKPKQQKKKEGRFSDEQKKSLEKAKQALSQVNAPSSLNNVAISRLQTTESDSTYSDSLARALKSMLTLPEYGEVALSVTLDRQGNVVNLQVTKAESHLNQQSIEKALRHAQFSSFGSNFSGESEHTFAIVLKNDY